MAEGLAVLSIGSGIVQGVSAYKQSRKQAEAMEEQLKFQRKVIAINQKMTNYKVSDALARGEEEVQALQNETSKITQAQRASFAARGIDISSGEAARYQDVTQIMSAMDEVKIKNNAWREAYGYKVEGYNASLQGKIQEATTRQNIRSTLAAGGLQAVGSVAGGLAQGAEWGYKAGWFGGKK